jgi:hydrogenase expression/formation protein HypE
MDKEKDKMDIQGPICPLPLVHSKQVILGHGSGGKMTHDLITRIFYPPFGNPTLLRGDDAAVIEGSLSGRLAICTDAHIVSPLFFPGGDIGRLAVCGTVNDLAMVGARPLYLTASFILEEGLAMDDLEKVALSMKAAAEEAGVMIVAGDTKVAERGSADGMFISTCGVGTVQEDRQVGGAYAKPGDIVLLSGPLGDHGIAVLAARGELAFDTEITSDIAPLNHLVEAMFGASNNIHVLRDPTRGGLATTLNEISRQSGVAIHLDEKAIPIRPAVEAACEMLGFDPLYVANEGKLVAIVSEEDADRILETMRHIPYGEMACRIGEVKVEPVGRVLMRTTIGGTRVVDILSGEMLPRIC